MDAPLLSLFLFVHEEGTLSSQPSIILSRTVSHARLTENDSWGGLGGIHRAVGGSMHVFLLHIVIVAWIRLRITLDQPVAVSSPPSTVNVALLLQCSLLIITVFKIFENNSYEKVEDHEVAESPKQDEID